MPVRLALAALVLAALAIPATADPLDPALYSQLKWRGIGPFRGGRTVGATGVRILATMLYEMQRRRARYGLETMCIGGGQGIAAIFERA